MVPVGWEVGKEPGHTIPDWGCGARLKRAWTSVGTRAPTPASPLGVDADRFGGGLQVDPESSGLTFSQLLRPPIVCTSLCLVDPSVLRGWPSSGTDFKSFHARAPMQGLQCIHSAALAPPHLQSSSSSILDKTPTFSSTGPTGTSGPTKQCS